MLLKDFYIDKFISKLAAARPLPTNDYNAGVVDGLQYAMNILREEKTKDGQTQEGQG